MSSYQVTTFEAYGEDDPEWFDLEDSGTPEEAAGRIFAEMYTQSFESPTSPLVVRDESGQDWFVECRGIEFDVRADVTKARKVEDL